MSKSKQNKLNRKQVALNLKSNNLLANKTVQTIPNDPIRLLIWGASPYVITGFGNVMKEILQNLFLGHPGHYDVYQLGINHHGDYYDEFSITGGVQNGRYRQWPAALSFGNRVNLYGQAKFVELINNLNVDIDCVFMFEDPFWIRGPIPESNPQVSFIDAVKQALSNKGLGHVPVVCYFPIDGKPKKSWVDTISKYDIPITYLNFGSQECIKLNPSLKDRLVVIPHGVNLKEFHPLSKDEVKQFKRTYFGDSFINKFMLLNVNRNQVRKLVPSCLVAFKEFKKLVPESFIYLHMKPMDVGWNLIEVCNMLDLKVDVDVVFPKDFNVQKGLSVDELNKVFNAADVLVSTAVGGGWELSISQAFATKTCVLMPANTSHVDLCGPQDDMEACRGLLYRSGSNFAQVIIFPSDNEVPRPLPDLDDMISKLKFLYDNPVLKTQLEENAYSWVKNNITWDKHIVPHFHEVFSGAKKLKLNRIQRKVENKESSIKVLDNVYFGTLKVD